MTTTTCTAREQINRRFPQVNTAVISNGVDLDLFRPSLRSEDVRSSLGVGPDDFLVGYCGLHGLFQGLEVVVETAARLAGNPGIKFVMVGDGPSKRSLVSLAESQGVTNLRFEDTVPRPMVASILASCDAAVAPLAAELPGTMPSKVYEALASGVPLVVTRGCEAEGLVNEHGVGTCLHTARLGRARLYHRRAGGRFRQHRGDEQEVPGAGGTVRPRPNHLPRGGGADSGIGGKTPAGLQALRAAGPLASITGLHALWEWIPASAGMTVRPWRLQNEPFRSLPVMICTGAC